VASQGQAKNANPSKGLERELEQKQKRDKVPIYNTDERSAPLYILNKMKV